jgi:hypothetical protein
LNSSSSHLCLPSVEIIDMYHHTQFTYIFIILYFYSDSFLFLLLLSTIWPALLSLLLQTYTNFIIV